MGTELERLPQAIAQSSDLLDHVKLEYVDSIDKAMEFKRWLGERRFTLAVDTETGGFDWWSVDLRLVQFADANTGWAIPWGDWAGVVKEALRDYEGRMTAHNLKFDGHFLEHHGKLKLKRGLWHDTMLMAHVLDPRQSVALKPLSAHFIDPKAAYASKALDVAMAANKWGWHDVPIDFFMYWAYGALDGVLTARLDEKIDPLLDQVGARRVYELERQVLWVLMQMERRGAHINPEYCERMIQTLNAYSWSIEEWAKTEFGIKISSNPQLAQALQDNGVELTVKTPKGKLSVAKGALVGLSHPLIDQALRYRRAQKLTGTYFENFLARRDGDVLHPSVRQLGTRTGRMTENGLGLQTLPRGNMVRGAFQAREGMKLLSTDYDQIEMRVLCHYAEGQLPEDQRPMLQSILAGDLHTETAKLVYSDPTITKKDKRRQTAKNAGFAKVYGAGVEKFAQTAGVTVEEARAFLDGYDRTYPGVRALQKQVEDVVMRRKFAEGVASVRSPVGRWHPADDGKEYALVNYLIQGTSADIFKEALVRLDDADLSQFLVMPVHDEAITEVPAEHAEELGRLIGEAMTDRNWLVEVTASTEGPFDNWGQKYSTSEFELTREEAEGFSELTSQREPDRPAWTPEDDEKFSSVRVDRGRDMAAQDKRHREDPYAAT